MSRFGRFAADKSGATAIEYALIATLIGVAIMTGVGSAGSRVVAMWESNAQNIQDAMATPAPAAQPDPTEP